MFCIFEDDKSICASNCAHTVYELVVVLTFGFKGLFQVFFCVERRESGDDFFDCFTLEGHGKSSSGLSIVN